MSAEDGRAGPGEEPGGAAAEEATEGGPRPGYEGIDEGTEPGADADGDPAPEVADPAADAGARADEERRTLADRMEDRTRIRVPARHNPTLSSLVDRVNLDDELYALWVAQNVNAVERLKISDHGPVHVQIVANSALRLLRLLMDAGVEPGIVADYGFGEDDAEVLVVLAALFHDVGISVHRDGHEAYSLFVAQPKLKTLLAEFYEPARATILRSEILHAVISHRAGGEPLTLEAGVLKVADALDMAEGRSRIPFESGSMSIHSVSAAAIEAVHIGPGEDHPVRVRVDMTNSAGVFQLDELLRKKLRGSGLEPYLQVEAHIEGESEKRLLQRFRL